MAGSVGGRTTGIWKGRVVGLAVARQGARGRCSRRGLWTTLARSSTDGSGREGERDGERDGRVVINGNAAGDDFREYGGDALGTRSNLDLTEPKAVVIVGALPEEGAHIRLLLDEIGGREYKVLQCNGKQAMLRKVSEVLQQGELDWEEPLELGSSVSLPAPGSPRLLLFCGLPRNEVDIVSAILDESKFEPFAVSVVTRHNSRKLLGDVVVKAVEEQRSSFKRRREFTNWKDALRKGENATLRKPIFTSEASQGAFSDVLRASSPRTEKREKTDSARNAVGDEAKTTPTSVSDRGKPGEEEEQSQTLGSEKELDATEPREDEEKIAEGFFSKPLDMDGVRRDLAQDMEDDKAFMNPWYARGLEKGESTLDIVKEEERAFIQKCLEAQKERQTVGQNETEHEGGDALSSGANSALFAEQEQLEEGEEEGLDDIILNASLSKGPPFPSSSSFGAAANVQEGSQDEDSDPSLPSSIDTNGSTMIAGAGDVKQNDLSEEDILEITGRFEDVDVESLLERFKQVKGKTEEDGLNFD